MKTKLNGYLLVGIMFVLCIMGLNCKVNAAEVRVLCVNGGAEDDEELFLYSASMFSDCIEDYYVNGIKIKESNCKYTENSSIATLDKAIDSAFAGAKDDDISIFFYSGHGTITEENGYAGLYTGDGSNYEFSRLYNKLKVIKGEKFVILDCCYSGSFITQNWIDKTKFTVICACEHNTFSPYFNKLTALTIFKGKKVRITHFSDKLLDGLGYYDGKLNADVDNNQSVSTDELFKYLQKKYQKTYLVNYNGELVLFKAVPQLYGECEFIFSKTSNMDIPASISLNTTETSVYVGKSITLKATITGNSKQIVWKSSDSSIVSVDENGKVTAKGKGTATISATANGKTASCKITVISPSIKLNKSSATIYTTGTKSVQLKATVKGPDSKVKWSSNNNSVAKVNSKGKVTAKKEGTVTISAKCNGVTAKCTINIRKKSNIYEEYYKLISTKNEYGMYDLYACTDINNDKIPELFVFDTRYESDGIDHVGYKVYTYKNNKLLYLGAIYGGSCICMFKDYSGVTCSCGDFLAVYRWKNGKLARTESYVYNYFFDTKLEDAVNKYSPLVKVISLSRSTENKAEHQKYLKSVLKVK